MHRPQEPTRQPAGAIGLSTQSVHAGDPRVESGPIEAPLVLSSAFAFASADEAAAAFRGESDAYVYGRWGSPTVEALEDKIAALERGASAVVTSSGMAAICGVLLTLTEAGGHVVAPRSMYAESARLLRERLPRFGVETTFVDATDIDAYERAIRPNSKLLYAETPANPTLGVTDLARLAELGKHRGIPTIADNTFATPWCQRPLDLGIDVVLHSMTKALSGHGDTIGGAVVTNRVLRDRIADTIVKGMGATLAPFNAFLIARGMRTFALRAARANESALAIASWLSARRGVVKVHYPGLHTHPGHPIAARQMRAFGSMLSFELEGGIDAGRQVLGRVELITHSVSLGDVRSLITHPASTTASTMPAGDRIAAGISDGLIRLSVGIEDVDDLLRDLDAALG